MSERRRAKQNRRARRRAERGIAAPRTALAFARLVARLHEGGFPVIVDGGVAYSYCPSCFDKGVRSLLEIRASSSGPRTRELDGERAELMLAELDAMAARDDAGRSA